MSIRRRDLLMSAAMPALTPARARTPVLAEVRSANGKPTLFLNGQPTYAAFYALTDCPGGRWSFEEEPQANLRRFTAAGFRLFQVDLFLELIWTKPGPMDLALAQRQLRGVMDACPDAAIVLRWHLNAPPWWMNQHPEELVRYANGDYEAIERTTPVRILMDDLRRAPRVSLASGVWREVAAARTRELLQGLAAAPEGRALAGVHVAHGVYGEWHYWGFMRNEPDVSAPMQREFGQWRQNQGRAAVPVPDAAARGRLTDGLFRDARDQAPVVDYYRCQQELVAREILHHAAIVKKSWPRPIVTGTFYGYFFSMFDRQATGGHLCLPQVLRSPAIDYLSAPQAYGSIYRDAGMSGISRALVESVRANGKLFLDEMDQTPSWTWQNNVDTAFRLSDLPSDIAILRRNVLESYTRGGGLWYYDFGPGNTSGWWADTRLMTEIRELRALLERYHRQPYRPAADVLFVFDTDVFYYTGSVAGGDPLTDKLAVNQTIAAAWRAGAALETIHLADLPRVDLSRFRAVVFANTWRLSAEQRRFIREKVMPGRHTVFQGLPGYLDGDRRDIAFGRELTGLDLQPDLDCRAHQPAWKAAGEAEHRSGSTWFFETPPSKFETWQRVFREAGCHLYTTQGEVIHAGGGLVAVHRKEEGSAVVKFPGGRTVQLESTGPVTAIYDGESGERVR